MEEKEIVEIDNKNYAVIDEINNNFITYVYLSNIEDSNDFCIRKASNNEADLLLGLDSEEEFDFALKLFVEKNANS